MCRRQAYTPIVVVLNGPVGRRFPSAAGAEHLRRRRLRYGGGGSTLACPAAQHDYALAVASDMPFLNAALLRAMLAARATMMCWCRARASAARATRSAWSLHAIYSRACLGPMQAIAEGGQRQIAAFVLMQVAYVEVEETRR